MGGEDETLCRIEESNLDEEDNSEDVGDDGEEEEDVKLRWWDERW